MHISATHASPIRAGGQTVAIGAASAASTFMNSHSGAVRVVSTVDCFIEFGASGATPTAVANTSLYLPALIAEYFAIPPNSKIAVIQSAAAGALYISQC